jgi:hypothetical protein
MVMKNYIFISSEGYTYSPSATDSEPDVENCQVLGFGVGADKESAFKYFIDNNQQLENLGFENVVCYELMKSEPEGYFCTKNHQII